MEAVILAGGRGTRLRPLTDTTPKPLLPFMGEPFAEGLLRRLVAVGATRATFLVGQDAEPWAALHLLGEEVELAVEVVTEETSLDTAGAARRLFAGAIATRADAVLVCNGDILTDLDFAAVLRTHRAGGATATIALTPVADTTAFGVVVTAAGGRVQRFVEKPPAGTVADNTINAGTYVLAPDAFARFPGDGPLSFERAVFPGLVEGGAVVLGHPSDAYWADLGTPQRYLDGHRDVLEGRCAYPHGPGMMIADGLAVHRSARVDPAAVLEPPVTIGPGCHVGAGARLRDVVLHERVTIGAAASVESAILGAGSNIAEGVAVPPGAVVGQGATVEA